ncbi:MAG: metallophosphoesterase [Candidatus Asgardarchaeia archaeon]
MNYEELVKNPINIRKLSKKSLIEILDAAKEIIEKERPLLTIDGEKVGFIGDLHGDLSSAIKVVRHLWQNKEIDKIIFLGDYVDRGDYQLETLNLVLILKILEPDRVYILRGNHETVLANRFYGFKIDLMQRNLEELYDLYNKFFALLPISAIVNKEIFSVHGGLASVLTVEDISIIDKLPRNDIEGTQPVLMELLWNDPNELVDTFTPSIRGEGIYYFGVKAFDKFMNKNNFRLFIRAHEFFEEGFKFYFNNRLLSLFSSSNYVGKKVNAKVAIVDKGLLIDLINLPSLKV